MSYEIGFTPMGTTAGGACHLCGRSYSEPGVHGLGLCKQPDSPRVSEVRYIGVTPDQVRQIVREEIRAALGKSQSLGKDE